MIKIGVLALQGDFNLHIKKLIDCGVKAIPVKKPGELLSCHGLIIPGGESTTLVKLLKDIELYQLIPVFNRQWPIFGTCAGTILLSSEVSNHPVEPLKLLDISVERNAYGRQIDSFVDRVELNLNGTAEYVEGVFIRAPKINRIGAGVRILGHHQTDIVLVESGSVLAATFHPELTESTSLHQYFIEKVKKHIAELP